MKKVFIGVLAALMLFAFTACEPSTMKVVQETGNPLIAKATAVTSETYYEGDTLETTDYLTVALEYTNGGSAEVVAAVKAKATLEGGNNLVQVVLPQQQGDCFVVISAIALNEELTVTLPADYKTTYTAEEYNTWTPSSTVPADPEKVELFYADGTLAKSFTKTTTTATDGEYTIAWDALNKEDIENIVISAKYDTSDITYKIPLTITKPAATVAKWQIQVNGKAGNDVTVTWGASKSAAEDQISVVELDSENKVIGVVEKDRYTLIGMPANFKEYTDAPTDETPDLDYTVTLVATNAVDVKYVDDAETSTSSGKYNNEITITVEDPIDWSTLKFEWADSAEFVVGGSVSTSDIEITALTTASGVDKSGDATVSAIASNDFRGQKEGAKVYVNFLVECDSETSAQQRLQTEALTKNS